MNLDTKVFNNIQAKPNVIKYEKKCTPWVSVIYSWHIRLFEHQKINQCNPSYQQTKEEKNMIVSIDKGKVFDKIQLTFTIKIFFSKLEIQINYINLIRRIYKKSTADVYANMEDSMLSPCIWKQSKDIHSHHSYST